MRVRVKAAPMARTAPWSAHVKILSTARLLMGLASAKRVKKIQTNTGAKLVG